MTIEERNAIVESYVPLVKSIVAAAIRSGQRPYVEADDLEQAGYVGLIKAIDAFPDNAGIGLTARLKIRVVAGVLAEIKRERRKWDNRIPWECLFNEDGEPLV